MSSRKNPLAIIDFQCAALKEILRFLREYGISTVEQLNVVNGKKLLEEPLWKLIEVNGKYSGPFISEGVKDTEDRLGRKVHPSSGTWPEAELQPLLNHPTNEYSLDDYRCQLDHVCEKDKIIRLIISKPEEVDKIIDSFNIVCVVLRPEHRKLEALPFNPEDVWQRYLKAKIRVWSRTHQEWVF